MHIGFSALQRAEIAEIRAAVVFPRDPTRFSALQRAEIAEIAVYARWTDGLNDVSVLFNEPKLLKLMVLAERDLADCVSVLFNEPKLLKCGILAAYRRSLRSFSALQRAEIAEMRGSRARAGQAAPFQCSSTSRNC